MRREARLLVETLEKQRLKDDIHAHTSGEEYDAEDASSDDGWSTAWFRTGRARAAMLSACVFVALCLAALVLHRLSRGRQAPYPPGLNYTQVLLGYDQPALRAAWGETQEGLEQALAEWLAWEDELYLRDVPKSRMGLVVSPHGDKVFRVLIASYVADSEAAAERLTSNLERLAGTRFDDTFEVAMFLYDGTDEHFRDRTWYADPHGPVVMREKRRLCRADALYLITPDMASNYSHIWILDGGMSLDMFSWNVYRTVLAGLEPLVSLPAVLAGTPEAGVPRPAGLAMSHWGTAVWSKFHNWAMPVTVDAARSDASGAVLAAELWPAVHDRLGLSDRRSDEYLSDVWDIAAVLSTECSSRLSPMVTLVVASPVRAVTPSVGPGGRCGGGCGDEGANCLPLSPLQWDLAAEVANHSVRWRDVDCFRHGGFGHMTFRKQCEMDLLVRGCRYMMSENRQLRLATLYNGRQVWLTKFKCLNVWPDGMADGECHPIHALR